MNFRGPNLGERYIIDVASRVTYFKRHRRPSKFHYGRSAFQRDITKYQALCRHEMKSRATKRHSKVCPKSSTVSQVGRIHYLPPSWIYFQRKCLEARAHYFGIGQEFINKKLSNFLKVGLATITADSFYYAYSLASELIPTWPIQPTLLTACLPNRTY